MNGWQRQLGRGLELAWTIIDYHLVLRGLLVFDQQSLFPHLDIPVRGSRVQDPENIALSPDGRHLALLARDDSTLEVYTLPPIAGTGTKR